MTVKERNFQYSSEFRKLIEEEDGKFRNRGLRKNYVSEVLGDFEEALPDNFRLKERIAFGNLHGISVERWASLPANLIEFSKVRFGLLGDLGESLENTARRLGISTKEASKLEKQTVRALRRG